jgi:hypothetical protein
MILLKFTLLHSAELITAGLLLAFIVLYFCYWLGDRQTKKEYQKKYDKLVWNIEYFPDEISKFSCKNYEKLQVLEQNFYKKFGK